MKYWQRHLIRGFILGLTLGAATMVGEANQKIPTIGYFPPTFPRDPVEVNVFLEHLLLGQVLEPIVQTGPDGSIRPAVAGHWTISPDSRLITFKVQEGLLFSNGKPVQSADIKYSLERHIQSASSQSKGYLKRIKKIIEKSPREVILELNSPYVAIFKALSRDQLGILPYGWKFDSKSAEPLIGTGPYRAVRVGDDWRLIANQKYRLSAEVAVKEWRIVFHDPKKYTIQQLPLVDLIPFASFDISRALQSRPDWKPDLYDRTRLSHFVQTSAWWYPHGKHFGDTEFRKRAMTATQDLLRLRAKTLGFPEATGVIPEGVPGYLRQKARSEAFKPQILKPVELKVAILRRAYEEVYNQAEVYEIESGHKVKFNFLVIDPTELDGLNKYQPDILIFSYAGGFHDPEGFLTVVTANLKAELTTILGKSYPTYERASSETDWNRRGSLYEDLNRELVHKQIIAPGWRPEIYSFASRSLMRLSPDLSYTPKLKEFKQSTGKEERP